MVREGPHVSRSSRFLSRACRYFLTTSAINVLLRLKDLHLAGRHCSHPRSHVGIVPSPTRRPLLISLPYLSCTPIRQPLPPPCLCPLVPLAWKNHFSHSRPQCRTSPFYLDTVALLWFTLFTGAHQGPGDPHKCSVLEAATSFPGPPSQRGTAD